MSCSRRFFFFFLFLSFFLFSGCESSSNDYFFEKPSSCSILKGVKCSNGSVSYIGFVVDNTEKYGARLMKISGCGLKIDDNFEDDIDGKTGLYVGGTGVWSDQIEIDGEVVIAVASSGYTEYEHWKNKDEDNKYDVHKGRVVFRKLGKDFKHDSSFDKSVLLNFYPFMVKAFNKTGFFVAGSNFGKNNIGFVDIDGKATFAEIEFQPSNIVAAGKKAYLFDKEKGAIYSVNELLEIEMVLEKELDPAIVNKGMSEIGKDRLAVFSGREVFIFNSSLEQIDQITLPEGYLVSSVTSVLYSDSFEYRKFSNEDMFESVEIFKREEGDEDTDEVTDENADSDMSDDSDEAADETEDEDAEYDDSFYDAQKGDIIWIASLAGNLIAYDLLNKSWLVTKYSSEDAASNPEYYNEMRPYVNGTYSTFPKSGETSADNIPVITDVYAIRGLPFPVTYTLTYEGIIEGTISDKGVLNNEKTILKDISVDFEKTEVNPQTDSAVLLNKDNSNVCPIPWNKNVLMDITELISKNEIGVTIENYSDYIEKCYGAELEYGIFPKEMYSVSRESYAGVSFAGRGVEHPSDYSGNGFSFSDHMVSISIRKTVDDQKTEKETSFYIKINPGVPFVGFNSADVMSSMFNVFPGRILMFSPVTRRIVEYDAQENSVVEIYK